MEQGSRHNCKEQMDSKKNFDARSNNSVYFIIQVPIYSTVI